MKLDPDNIVIEIVIHPDDLNGPHRLSLNDMWEWCTVEVRGTTIYKGEIITESFEAINIGYYDDLKLILINQLEERINAAR